jgi:hypothetical protein
MRLRLPKKVIIAVLGGVSIAGLAGASAASLGGLTASSIGSDDSVVAACDSDGITIAYTTSYSATAQQYQVSAVNFTNVNAACTGKAASVSLRNGATLLTTQAASPITVATGAFSITLTTPVAATSVTGVSRVISG